MHKIVTTFVIVEPTYLFILYGGVHGAEMSVRGSDLSRVRVWMSGEEHWGGQGHPQLSSLLCLYSKL